MSGQRAKVPPNGRFELLGGMVVCAFAAFFYCGWAPDTSGHGERAFLLLPVVVLAPFGIGSLLAGAALHYSWPKAYLFSATPFLLTFTAILALWSSC